MTRRYISSKSSLVLVVVLDVVFFCPFFVVVSKIGGGGGGATVVGLHRRWLFFRVLGPLFVLVAICRRRRFRSVRVV